MTDPHESRRRAYRYIVEQSKKLNWALGHRSDKTIVELNYISLNDLEKLFSRIATQNEMDEIVIGDTLTLSILDL